MLTDEKLMNDVRDGHLKEMSELWNRYHVRIYNYFRRTGLDKSQSEDLTQTAFERAIKYRNSYKDSYPFKAWIYRIASNVKIDYFKKNAKNNFSGLEHVEAVSSDTADSHILSKEKYNHLYKAMATLTDEQKQVIYLSKYEEMKYVQIAEILGCSESALKVKVHRAMKSLKSAFLNQNHEG